MGHDTVRIGISSSPEPSPKKVCSVGITCHTDVVICPVPKREQDYSKIVILLPKVLFCRKKKRLIFIIHVKLQIFQVSHVLCLLFLLY